MAVHGRPFSFYAGDIVWRERTLKLVLGEGGKELFVEKRRMTRPVETLEIVVSGKPVRAGIDPFHELIDAHPDDNVRSL